jgi:hypothetical protein
MGGAPSPATYHRESSSLKACPLSTHLFFIRRVKPSHLFAFVEA